MGRINYSHRYRCVVSLIVAVTLMRPAGAFIIDPMVTPWTSTASGRRSGNGASGTLTWSIVPDGTPVSDGVGNLGGSDLIAFLNENFDGNPLQSDHTEQPWFPILNGSFNRWSEVSGLSFVYEPNDDGRNHTDRRGILGTRGDIRVAGASIDGSGGTLAFNFLPEFGGDMVLDTDETSFADSSRLLSSTIMHEIGHAFGLSHVRSTTDDLLMDPVVNTSIDGPQLDEVRGIHYFFGDVFEHGNGADGNNSSQFATDLGELAIGAALMVGRDADVPSQSISINAVDFVSISNAKDLDYYSFTVNGQALLSVELTPLGGVFSQGSEFGRPQTFDADARSNLSLSILAGDGATVLEFADETPAGEGEHLEAIRLDSGNYFARIEGAEEDAIQMYMLDLQLSALPLDCNADGLLDGDDLACSCVSGLADLLTELGTVAGDLDLDGTVGFADFLTLSNHFGGPGSYTEGDLDCDGKVAFSDFLILTNRFGSTEATMNLAAVPEPAGLMGPLLALLGAIAMKRKRITDG